MVRPARHSIGDTRRAQRVRRRRLVRPLQLVPPVRRPPAPGVALISALLLVALATATAVYISTQSSLRLRAATEQQALVQAQASARAGIDFGRWALRDDAVRDAANPHAVDALTEPWAQALPPFPVEGGSVTGLVNDAQARINLNNAGLSHSPFDAQVLQSLLTQLHLDPALANAVTDWVDGDDQATLPGGAEDLAYLAMTPARRAANRPLLDVDELLSVRGFTPAMVEALRPFVTALPVHTPVNVNTASPEVLAVLFGIGSNDSEALVTTRALQPFTDQADLLERGPPTLAKILQGAAAGTAVTTRALPAFSNDWAVTSHYFQIDARASYGQVQYGLSALVRRDNSATFPALLAQRRIVF